MRFWIAGVLAALTWAGGAAAAQDYADCAVAAQLAYADYGLARVAAAIDQKKHLDIAVLGSGSSMLPAANGANLAYPDRLVPALATRFPGVETRVVSYAKMGRTAEAMAKDMAKLVKEAKPNLVIWQTGTVDAMRGVDPDEFRNALDQGVTTLQGAGVDVVLMNMQYSPRTEFAIATASYADNMRVVAQQREVPLFDRFAIMKHWSELGTFDLFAAPKNLETAARVHECIAQLLADVIVEGVKLSRPQLKVLQ
jgi:lysophospholipase L1-like esterase